MSSLDEPGVMDGLRERFADVLDDLATDPKFSQYETSLDLSENIRGGKKVLSNGLMENRFKYLVDIFGLFSKDEARLRAEFFEEESVVS